MIDLLFQKILKRFRTWLKNKPTGQFSVTLTVNNGGVRGKPKISVTDDL